jgi:hypothetical protein
VRKLAFLPGEISGVRASEKSAEAIVVMIAVERRKEQRAEGNKAKLYRALCLGE